jgi:cardiolipin synthase (CMP-forming)
VRKAASSVLPASPCCTIVVGRSIPVVWALDGNAPGTGKYALRRELQLFATGLTTGRGRRPSQETVAAGRWHFKRAMTDGWITRLNPLRNAPNLLTLLRICLAPFLVSAVLDNRFEMSFILFLAAGVTDLLDGLLARLLKQRTMLGLYLDPVADKLLLSTLFLVLMYKGLIPAHVTVLVLGRDVGILLVSAILYAAAGRREFFPSLFGKANTLAQIVAVAVVLLHQFNHAPWVVVMRSLALNATIALTVASGLHYAWLVARRSPAAPAASPGTK